MSFDIERFRQTYYEESFEGLDIMESGLLNLEPGSADIELINTIFRAAHSIKGGSTTFGTASIGGFTHVLETLLDEMREGERGVDQEIVDLLLESVDILRDMLAAAQQGVGHDEGRADTVQKQLESALGTGEPDSSSAAPTPSEESSEPGVECGSWHIVFSPYASMLVTGNDPVRMFRNLEEIGSLKVEVDTSRLPSFESLEPEDCYLKFEVRLDGAATRDAVEDVFSWVDDECDLELSLLDREGSTTDDDEDVEEDKSSSSDDKERKAPPAAQTPEAGAKPPATSGSKVPAGQTSSIRVAIDKIDAIVNMVGELVITQSMLGQLGADFDMGKVDKLKGGLAQLERNTRELQDAVMRIRMLPISFAFNRLPRMIHDLAGKLQKKVELKVAGETTELDKTVLEKIGDPLVHLVRNSLDHGIETPDLRLQAGKPETGVLSLNAYHQGGNIIIEIADDGAGLNPEKILAKAKSKGLIGDDEVLTPERIQDLIFQPGFSTAAEVSDISGRGVGMDVVRRNIKALGGNVGVKSTPGKGTTFTIRLPLTLAILDGQLVRVGEHTYILPLVSIIESIQVREENVNDVAGRVELYSLRDEYIPVVRLYDVFRIPADHTDLVGNLLVIVEGDGRRAGLLVDDLLGQQQVVIKSLESNYKRIPGVSGATILGEGSVALILDVAGLIQLAYD